VVDYTPSGGVKGSEKILNFLFINVFFSFHLQQDILKEE
jgi:hypothetical protein